MSNIIPLKKHFTSLNTGETENSHGLYMWFGEYGACPECGYEGTPISVKNISCRYCSEHNLYWIYNSKSNERQESEAEAINKANFILQHEHVMPISTTDVAIIFHKEWSKEDVLRQLSIQIKFLEKNWHRLKR